jgi:hypothetical protein
LDFVFSLKWGLPLHFASYFNQRDVRGIDVIEGMNA